MTSTDELVDPVASARMSPMARQPGVMRGEWARLELDGAFVEVGGYSLPIVTHGETLPGRLSILTPLSPVSGRLNCETLVPGLLLTCGGATEVQGATESSAMVGVMSWPAHEVEHRAELLGVDVDLPGRGSFRPVVAHEPRRLDQLFATTLRLARTAAGGLDARHAGALRDDALDLVVRSFDRRRAGPRAGERHLNSLRISGVCQAYARETSYQDVSMASLCAVSGVSERRVRHAFYECFDMSPSAYLRVLALHEVRRALLAGPPSRSAVSRLAMDHGFCHLGRFAAQYRALFGETPSATLARPRVARAG